MQEAAPVEDPDPEFDWEASSVYYNRYHEAKRAGMTIAERKLFASSDTDIGVLRELVEKGCPPELIAQIVL